MDRKAEKVKTRTSITNRLHKGFTVLELLIVVVIVALAAGLSVGYFAGTYNNMLLRKNARDIVGMAKYARLRAIESHSRTKIVFDQTQGKICLSADQEDVGGQINEIMVNESYCRAITLLDGIYLGRIRIEPAFGYGGDEGMEGQSIKFYPDGKCNKSIVELTDGKGMYSVLIYPQSGRVAVEHGAIEILDDEVIDLDNGENMQ